MSRQAYCGALASYGREKLCVIRFALVGMLTHGVVLVLVFY
jgi:hypothetical protein